jgi:predicted metal-dependent peptidase
MNKLNTIIDGSRQKDSMNDNKVQAPKGVLDIDTMTDAEFEAYEKTTLMAPDDMAEAMMEYMFYLRGDVMQQGIVMPRFGLLSMKARRTPMYCYAHPELKQLFANSFNDGKHIFVSDDYMRELIKAEDRCYEDFLAEEKRDPAKMKKKQPKEGMVPLLLHHLMHMIMNHHKRFKGFPSDLASIGADISVYSKLKLAFPTMEWVPELDEAFPASKLSHEDLKKYAKLSEESIIREVAGRYRSRLPTSDELLDQEAHDEIDHDQDSQAQADESDSKSNEKKKGDTPQKGEKGQTGDDQDGEPSHDDGEPGDGAGTVQEMDKDTMAQVLKEMGMKLSQKQIDQLDGAPDTIDMKQMSSMVEDVGLDATQERLEIPHAWDYSKIDSIEKETRLNDIDDIAKSVKLAGQEGTMGGGHLEGAAHEEVIKETEGKLYWKMGLQEVLGQSMNYQYSEAEPGDLYFVDPKDMGLNVEIYIGAELPHKTEGTILVLMDTSGSITEPLFKMFMAEIFGLIRNENSESSKASEVVLLFCDDVIRGEPVIINEDNYEEISSKKMEVYGRGGNDIGGTIKAASQLEMFEEKKINGIIYFTDLGDAPPTKKDVPEGVPLVFVCPPDYYQDEFIKAVKDFASVYPIEDGMKVDLTRDGYLLDQGPKPKTAKRKF